MKLFNFIIVMMFFIIVAISCSSKKQIDYDKLQKRGELFYEINKEEPFTGKAIAKYNKTQKKMEINIYNGLRDGIGIEWYDNGQKKFEGEFSEGKRDGIFNEWYRNRQKKSVEHFADGLKDGEFLKWYEDGQKEFEGQYSKDKPNGKFITWFRDGNKKSLEHFSNGAKYGVFKKWNGDGQILEEITYKNNELDGTYKTWYENGQQENKGIYKKNKKNGEWIKWNRYGNLVSQDIYKEDFVVVEIDGKLINLVKIGNQIWMAKNLNVNRFKNGDRIPHAKTKLEWKLAGENREPAWCFTDNNPLNPSNTGEKGRLYNWYAVNDLRGLAPKGFHIPSYYEFNKLLQFNNGNGFDLFNGNSYSPVEFEGKRNYDGSENYSLASAYLWSSASEYNFAYYIYIYLAANSDSRAGVDLVKGNKNNGFSVRCIKD